MTEKTDETDRDRNRDRETETDKEGRQRHTETETETGRDRDRQTDRLTEKTEKTDRDRARFVTERRKRKGWNARDWKGCATLSKFHDPRNSRARSICISIRCYLTLTAKPDGRLFTLHALKLCPSLTSSCALPVLPGLPMHAAAVS